MCGGYVDRASQTSEITREKTLEDYVNTLIDLWLGGEIVTPLRAGLILLFWGCAFCAALLGSLAIMEGKK